MNNMKNKLVNFGITTLMLLGGGVLNIVNAGPSLGIQSPVKIQTLEQLVTQISNIIRPVVIIALIFMLVYGGWMYMTARDDMDQVGNAKKVIMSALVGFAIIVLAPVIVEFVGSLIGAGNTLDTINN